MITRNLSRRLERLAGQMMPPDEVRFWNVRIMNSGGTEAPSGCTIEWSAWVSRGLLLTQPDPTGKRARCEFSARVRDARSRERSDQTVPETGKVRGCCSPELCVSA
jgi:hypothetical protein